MSFRNWCVLAAAAVIAVSAQLAIQFSRAQEMENDTSATEVVEVANAVFFTPDTTFANNLIVARPSQALQDTFAHLRRRLNLSPRIELVVGNAQSSGLGIAVATRGNAPRRFLILDPSIGVPFVPGRSQQDWPHLLIFLHEIAHHQNGDVEGASPEKENRADQWAGFAAAQLGASWPTVETALQSLSPGVIRSGLENRIAQFRIGWNNFVEDHPRAGPDCVGYDHQGNCTMCEFKNLPPPLRTGETFTYSCPRMPQQTSITFAIEVMVRPTETSERSYVSIALSPAPLPWETERTVYRHLTELEQDTRDHALLLQARMTYMAEQHQDPLQRRITVDGCYSVSGESGGRTLHRQTCEFSPLPGREIVARICVIGDGC